MVLLSVSYFIAVLSGHWGYDKKIVEINVWCVSVGDMGQSGWDGGKGEGLGAVVNIERIRPLYQPIIALIQ